MIILTLNEERHIAECVQSVRAANEIIVVDSGSTDRTLEIASKYGAKVNTHKFEDFATQRNYAASLATSDWILHLDADERVTPQLWAEMSSVTSTGAYDAYLVPSLNVTFGAPLRHGGWYPQYHLRLQRKNKGTWLGSVHELASVEGPVGRLSQPIVHYGHPDIHTFLKKLDHYTSIEARQLRSNPLLLGLMAVILPVPHFVYKYVFQLGFADGWRGLAIALLMSFYRCTTYLKALEQRTQRSDGANES